MLAMKFLWICFCCLLTSKLCTTQNDYPGENDYGDNSYNSNSGVINNNFLTTKRNAPTNDFSSVAEQSLHNFTFDIFNAAHNREPNGNMILSPLSVYSSLAMLRPGLHGQSRSQVTQALGAARLNNKAIGTMLQAIYSGSGRYDLVHANRVFVDESVRIKTSYRKKLKKLRGGIVKKINFMEHPYQSRSKINGFVKKQTKKMIQNFLPEGSVDPLTRIMLINAIHLKANWNHPFYSQNTEMKPFYLHNNQTIMTSTMHGTSIPCTIQRNENFNADIFVLSLDGNLSMMFMLPTTPGNFSSLFDDEQEKSKSKFKRIFNEIWPTENREDRAQDFCNVELPKFKVEYQTDLKQSLRTIGISDIFDETAADLSAMQQKIRGKKTPKLFVKEARHKTVMTTNETGIKASAVTSFEIGLRLATGNRVVRVNKPFLFIVRQDRTGAVLFAGRIARPQST